MKRHSHKMVLESVKARLFLGLICMLVTLVSVAQDFEAQVQEMYVAYYGRPGDPGGVEYWADQLESQGGDLASIIDAFGTSEEFEDRFGSLEDEELINNIYQQLFGRDADPEGLDFYLDELQSGQATLASIALNVSDGVQPGTDDAAILNNKLELASHFTDTVEELDVDYGSDQIDDAKALLAGVDSSDSSLEEALGATEDLVEGFPEPGGDVPGLKDAKLLVEHNATDEDTGFQGFFDGEPWNELVITGPGDERILSVNPEGGLFDFGLTELFFETSEPENAEVPIENVLARLDEGEYTATGDIVDGEESTFSTPFTHDIPAGPELTAPEDGAEEVDPANVVVSWNPVTEDINGSDVEIVGYQVIVEEDVEPEFPSGFAAPVFSIYLPSDATSVGVPPEFMGNDKCYKYEVLAIEESGNQTLSSAEFETGEGCESEEEMEDDTPSLSDAKLLIEHNATDRDTGFQGFADGDPWNSLTISGPGDVPILMVQAEGGFLNFGLTELFFETSEPENDEVSIDEVLERLPEGTYTFTGDMVDGEPSMLTATFTHDIPAGPALTNPPDGASEVDPNNLVISWDPVTTDIDGDDITIVGYQVIVELDEEPEFPEGFAEAVFSVYLPASATSVSVPAEFMESGESYAYEVLAIEVSGNQTLSSAEFETE